MRSYYNDTHCSPKQSCHQKCGNTYYFKVIFAFASVVVCLNSSRPAYADFIVNGSFETGDLTGWNSVGGVSVRDVTYGFLPASGNSYAVIESSPNALSSVPVAILETALAVTPGIFQSHSNQLVVQGSAVYQTVTVSAGDSLAFSFEFATNNDVIPDPDFNDFAFLSISHGDSLTPLANTFSVLGSSPSPFFAWSTGSRSFTYEFHESGTYIIGFGSVDVGDAFVDSALVLDSVSIVSASVPEPSSLILALIGGLSFCYALSFRLIHRVVCCYVTKWIVGHVKL